MALTGLETLYVLGQNPTGRPAAEEFQTTTGAIAALAESFDTTDLALTALTTVGAGTITAAGIVGGATLRGGSQSASPFTDTTATAALIIAALPSWAQVGQAFYYTYINNTDAVATIAGGSSVTVSGITTVQPNMVARFLVTYATSSTVTVAGIDTAIYSPTGITTLPGALTVNGNTILGNASTDTVTITGLTATSATTTDTALANTYGIVGNLTCSATDIVSGNARGVRGAVTMSGTVTGGAYIYGVQGKTIVTGTINHADSHIGGGFSQLDVSAATLTAGYVDGHWIDMGATAPGGGFAAGYSQVVRATNSTAGTVNSIYYGYGKATYGFDLSDNSAGWITIGTAPSTLSGSIKVNVNGNTRYIALYTNAS